MAAASVKNEKTTKEELSIGERLNDLIQKNRTNLLVGLIAIVVILAGVIIFITVSDKMKAASFSKISAYDRRYEELRPFIGSDDADAETKQAEIAALLDELNLFARKNSGFAAARAYYTSANIFWDEKNWAEAEIAWNSSAEAAAKSYLAPVALFNAASAAEEQGNIDTAIAFLNRAMNYGDSFPAAAKAQFSIGRLEESRNNKSAAIEAYNALLGKWPNDQIWANLAQSRLIILSN